MIAPAEAAESGLGVHKPSDNTAGSMQIVVQDVAQECSAADCLVAAANRGLGNSGLRLIGDKEYEGYFFARREPDSGDGGPKDSRQSPARLIVRLEDYTAAGGVAAVLAEQTFLVPEGADWTMFNFSLTPSASTTCRFLDGPNETNGTDVEPCRGAASTRTETTAEHSCI